MTTIVIDRKQKQIYTDTRGTMRYNKIERLFKNKTMEIWDDTQKCYKVGNLLITGCGCNRALLAVVDYLSDYKNRNLHNLLLMYQAKSKSDSDIYVCYDDQISSCLKVKKISIKYKPKWFRRNFEITESYPKETEIFNGSGAKYAEAAFKAGAPLSSCIKSSIMLDLYSGGNITINGDCKND